MATTERRLMSAMTLAAEEINRDGGVLGHAVRAIAYDGRSDPKFFADRAEVLITGDHVATIFGCWTSSTRKAVRPVVEAHNSLLWYPVQYEGMEESPNIIYTGSCLNQQIEPALSWVEKHGVKRAALIGSDHVYPHVANTLIRSLASGRGIEIVSEHYVALDETDFHPILSSCRDQAVDMILCTVNGNSNTWLLKQAAESSSAPLLTFSCSEVDLVDAGPSAEGNYACWGYFESINTADNREFVTRYRRRFGANARVSDPVAAAYMQVHLWKEIVESIGTFDPVEVRRAAPSVSVTGPLGELRIQENGHVRRLAMVGRARSDGQFDVVWSSREPIDPKPWFGLEDQSFASSRLLREVVRSYSETLHDNCELHEQLLQRGRVEEVLQERALRLAQLSQAVEHSPVSVVITDVEGSITYVNPEFTQLTGYSADEAMGKNPRIIKSGRTPQSVYEELWSTILGGGVWRGEFLNRKRSGDLYWELAVIAPLLDASGHILSFIAVKVDITKRKRAEEALTAANEQLERHVAEIEELQAQLQDQAVRDPLTRLYNRRFLEETLDREFHTARRHDQTLSVILADIDHFKKINDTYGHRAGDEYLIQLAEVLESQVRRSDIVCRLGGEEFLVILPDCDAESAATLAENLRRIVEKTWLITSGAEIHATISLGVVSCPGGRGGADDTIDNADKAMYESKRAGRNRVTVWSDDQ